MRKYLLPLLFLTSCATHPPVYVPNGNTKVEAKAPKGILETPEGTEHKKANAIFFPAYVIRPKQDLKGGEQEAFIDPSVKAWNEAMGFGLIKKEGPGYPITAIYVETLPAGYEKAAALAYRYLDHCDIYIKHAFTATGLDLNILIHELGHCIGFDHSTWEWSVMWPEVNWDQRITNQMRMIILDALGAEEK